MDENEIVTMTLFFRIQTKSSETIAYRLYEGEIVWCAKQLISTSVCCQEIKKIIAGSYVDNFWSI